MRLVDLYEDTSKKPPAPGSLGDLYTTKQAAQMIGISVSRLRQLKMEGRAHPVEGPVPGHQESLWSAKEIERIKKMLEKSKKENMGRPPKSKKKK